MQISRAGVSKNTLHPPTCMIYWLRCLKLEGMTMNAKFGKISIGCFVANVAVLITLLTFGSG